MNNETREQTVDEIMTRHLVSVRSEASVREAAEAMLRADVGTVVVIDGERLHGILTDRDIVVRCVAEGNDCDETRVSEICSPQVATLRPTDRVQFAVELMRENAIRRAPVVEEGVTVGIVSLGDLAIHRDPESVLGAISAASPNH